MVLEPAKRYQTSFKIKKSQGYQFYRDETGFIVRDRHVKLFWKFNLRDHYVIKKVVCDGRLYVESTGGV